MHRGEARLRIAMLRFSPELPVLPGKSWLSQPQGKGSPQPLSKGLSPRGALHAASFWPREGSFCCSAVTSKPFRPQGLFRAPCLAKGSPPPDLFLPP